MDQEVVFPFDEAIRKTMEIEKHAMNYYRACAGVMKDRRAAELFALLAQEEREHAESFYRAYLRNDLEDFETYIETRDDARQGWLAEAGQSLATLNEREAMRIALDKERRLEEHLRAMAKLMSDPAVRAVFIENADLTNRHYQLIESEYARLMAMVHESEIDTFVRE